jgi:hypothetical protein
MAPDPKAAALKGPAREAELQRQRLRESVKDLALYLGKMSGAKIEVSTAPPAPGDKRLPILVSDLAARAFGPPKKKAAFRQGFRLVVSPRGIGLLGESDLAVSYAVYELLDRLGCRWYLPSELGEVCQGTRSATRLGDANRYEPNRQPRNARGLPPPFPDLPNHGSRSLFAAAAG